MYEQGKIIHANDPNRPMSEEDRRVLQAWRERVVREGIEFLERRRAERERGEDRPQGRA